MTNNDETAAAYAEFARADKVWSAELRRAFPKGHSRARYKPEGEGEPGSTLRMAYNEFQRTGYAWRKLVGFVGLDPEV